MRIALFGGSFDPPHRGHVAIIEAAFRALPIDRLYIAPTYLNPFKNSARFPASLRLKWMRDIARDSRDSECIEVTDFEIAKGAPTPTIQTVRFLKERGKIEHFYLLLGSDQLPRLHEWHSFAELKKLVEFVIIRRDEAEIARSFRTLELSERISSSEIRTELDKGELSGALKEAIPACIRDEVLAQNPISI